MNRKATDWVAEKENQDGSGYTYYSCRCPQYDDTGCLRHLYVLCYSPTTKEVWFWDSSFEASESVRMFNANKGTAEIIKKLLTKNRRQNV